MKAIKRITAVILALLLIFPFQPLTDSYVHAEEGKVSISTATLNVRTGPGLSYPVLTQVHRNQTFNIVETKRDWYKISTEDGEGWVADWLVTRVSNGVVNESGEHGTVSTNGLRLRKGPSTSEAVVTVLNKGDKVTISESRGNWLSVKSGNADGWVHNDYVDLNGQSSSSASSPKKQEAKQGVITAGTLNVRKSPSLQSPIAGAVHRGNTISITGSVSGWYEIQFGNAKGWISDNYVEISSTPAAAPSSSSEFTGMITVNSLNVRSEASLNGSIIGKVNKGEKYPILNDRNNWVQIKLSSGKSGWIAGWFVQKTVAEEQKKSSSASQSAGEKVTILHNGTNIRRSADVQSGVVKRANSGETFPVTDKTGDWYEIKMEDGTTAYVAGWIVSIRTGNGSESSPSRNTSGGINDKVIIIDPGHGGRDSGTIGTRGTLEKLITMKTGQLLADKLRSAGAEVVLTRKNDEYVSLPSRVSLSHYYDSDAFISIHFDSIYDTSVAGHTTFYNKSYQKDLAYDVHESLASRLPSRDRGVRLGDYHVIRENKQAAILLELGFLSNPAEEANMTSHYYQDLAATAIYHGLNDYFSN
ncbi:SH3 domain-containing protein [Bacillus sp. Marseille-Q1617]|uniref:SH3 domain-containing protein n=1 Tax=Bacillus sp. Marseille-Q1617 TaxID=2736887 RepID=UPI00158E0976|nr:SH3 domain-containing protein [Bacillus sp. Marseille-Q1617]